MQRISTLAHGGQRNGDVKSIKVTLIQYDA
jgi:hypothetical protein